MDDGGADRPDAVGASLASARDPLRGPHARDGRARHRGREAVRRRCQLRRRGGARAQGRRQGAALHRGRAECSVSTLPDARGHFGRYGGRYVPETLMSPLIDLERAYLAARRDRKFQARLRTLMTEYAGRPTPLYFAERLTEHAGGARIYLKREDLCHTGAHKINNVLGQGLLAQRMKKHRVIA